MQPTTPLLRLKLAFFPALLALAALACGLPNTATPASVATEASSAPTEMALPPSETPAAPPPASETPAAPAPTAVEATPTETTAPTATIEPTPAAPLPDFPLPNGFVTVSNADTLIWRAPDGGELASVIAPGVNSRFVHAAGWPTFDASFAAAYQTYDHDGAVMLAVGDSAWQVGNHPHVLAVGGAPGLPIAAFGSGEWDINTNIWTGMLFVGDFDTLVTSAPLLTFNQPESHYPIPLMVHAASGYALGVWFTYEPWGIGGDIVFPPHNGLYYIATADGSLTEVLSQDYNPSALSLDQTWVAFTGPGFGASAPMTVRNLESGVSLQIPLRPESDRGAGYGVFSPGNGYLAWMEASGSNMSETPNFQQVVRIATLDGQMTAELSLTELAAAAGFDLAWVNPVGWLDAETLLLQGRGENWEDAFVLRVRFDGTAGLLVGGTFAGFTYP